MMLPDTFGISLRAARKARGMTQEQAANIAGVKRPTWSLWEHGHARPPHGTLVKIIEGLSPDKETRMALAGVYGLPCRDVEAA